MALIYCIEDDDSIRELVVYALKSNGFEAIGYPSGQGLDFIKADLVLLDIMLPKEDGFTILKKIRSDAETESLPVIMLTAKTGEIDKVRSLDMGADDYVEKPFSIMELISRVKAVLRRSYRDCEDKKLSYKGITMDLEKYQVEASGREISLTNKEFQLLKYLLENQSLVLSRQTILEKVWGFDYQGETRTIDVHIRSLRLKLGMNGEHIKTVINVGYKLGE